MSFILEDEQLATIYQYAKDQGYPSASAALRRIIDEWVALKEAQLRPLQTQCQ